jgi:transcriptional regulator with XRE-family HTH domain
MNNRNLRQLRRDAGLTQYALAKATGIDRTKISHAELGVVKLTEDEFNRIRKVLLDLAREKSARVLKTLEPGPSATRRNSVATASAPLRRKS